MDMSYEWIDKGSEYDIAVEQSVYYNHGMEEIEEIKAFNEDLVDAEGLILCCDTES